MGFASFLRELVGRTDATAEKDRILDLNKLKLQEEFARAREKVGFSVQFALLVLRGLTLINGGAIIALFTFLGAASQKSAPLSLNNVSLLWWSFGFFASGLSLAVLASFLSYMAQYHQADAEYSSPYNNYIDLTGASDAKLNYQQHMVRFRRFRFWAFVAGLISLLMFVLGSGASLSSTIPRHSSPRAKTSVPAASHGPISRPAVPRTAAAAKAAAAPAAMPVTARDIEPRSKVD